MIFHAHFIYSANVSPEVILITELLLIKPVKSGIMKI